MQTKQTRTTIHLTLPPLPDPRGLWNLPIPATIAITVFCLISIAAIVGRIQQAPALAPMSPVIIIATAQSVAVPIATPMAQQVAVQIPAVRYVVAFAAPDGAVLGPIEAPALGAIVARYSDQWVATMHDGVMVWVRISELGASLGNLAPELPVVAPMPYVSAPQPAYAPALDYTVANDPQPPEQPPEQPAAPAAAPMVAQPVQQPQTVVNPRWFYEQTDVQVESQRIAGCQEHPEWNCK